MDKNDLLKIDRALGRLGDFSKHSRGTTGAIQKMRQDVLFTDGLFSSKVKTLAAALWAVSARCEPCITFYIAKAKEYGATEAEVGEVMSIASTMGGCVGEMWALKAYNAFKEDSHSEGTSCCR